MKQKKCVICPFIKAAPEGEICGRRGELVSKLHEGDLRFCMSAHYEVCSIYIHEIYKDLECRES